MAETVLRKKTDDELRYIMDEVVRRILMESQLQICKIILYGSYARGTADGESDIDIMVLCRNSNEEADRYSGSIFRSADKVAFDNDIMIQTNVKNADFFEEWIEDLPYFRNVKNEGVVLYERA